MLKNGEITARNGRLASHVLLQKGKELFVALGGYGTECWFTYRESSFSVKCGNFMAV